MANGLGRQAAAALVTAAALAAVLLLRAGGIAEGGPAAASLLTLATLIALPVLAPALTSRRTAVLVPAGAVLAAIALAATGLAVDRFDEDHPQPVNLNYLLDAGTGTATWTSLDRRPDPWVTAHAPHAGGDPPVPLPFGDRPRWIGPAPTSTLPPPELTVRSSRADGADTLLVLHLDSMRGAQLLTLHVDRPVTGVELAIDGLAPVATSPPRGAGPWPFELQFSAPPPTGVEVRVRLPGHGPLRLALTDYTVGLPTPARSAALTASTRTTSDLVGVGRIHLIDARAIGRGVGWPGR